MEFMELYKRFNAWRRNMHHMWSEKAERRNFFDYLDREDIQYRDEIKAYFSKHCLYGCPVFPYEWALESTDADVKVYSDLQNEMYYVNWNGKKMFWKKGVEKEAVQHGVHCLQIEQHSKSPHKYEFPIDIKDAVIADLGAAEGCFTLDIIDRVKHAYLFECGEEWIEPLQATFAPWKNKVTIVNKYVGNSSHGDYTTLDAYFEDKQLDFIKADIEGAEVNALIGGEKVIRNVVRAVDFCLYHTQTDEKEILSILDKYGYSCRINPRYMFFYDGRHKELDYWLRRGVVHATRY